MLQQLTTCPKTNKFYLMLQEQSSKGGAKKGSHKSLSIFDVFYWRGELKYLAGVKDKRSQFIPMNRNEKYVSYVS